ncbi:Gfo/Idh/MocA family oxidoreductase [Nocardia farcinica]|nr:Gfo/Idh/MocA family oxidoreductase [Nocardia farcinica]MBF6310951.1 Gfo/Idh/MocA family oxidoreductase [Nocardia farcinica]MBF6409887.1 Gfo/Idh/MocA family oxidoreductase [Nocardia farcinica]PEH77231.1 dehydrogenase [Nocardia sp. FDAARGOS_372]UEX21744.1 Gfo/Idh/MocA family oxidoreductase [Nocardia farcinica]
MTALDCARVDQLPEASTSAGELPSRPLTLVPRRRVPLRVGVIGLGRQALDDHLPGLASCEAAELVAVCDEDPEIVREHQYRCRVPGYTSFTAMLGSEQLDLVVVCVPHCVGRRVIEAAAEHRVHVLKEKPFATSLTEARELARLCEDSEIELMVTLQRRFNPIYTSFPQLADQIGTPFVIDARYTLHTADPSDGWRGDIATAGGGCLIDMGYHVIDLILWYFGLPDRITADLSVAARPDREYDAEDTALVHFSYDSGLYGSILLSRFIGPKTEDLRLVGSKGMVHLERGRIRRLTNDGEVVESLLREQAWPSAAATQLDYFRRVIDGERPNLSGPRQHLAHLRFVTACYQAARTHTCIDPKELR